MERNWTYRDPAGEQHGPYTRQELLRYAEDDRIDPRGVVRCEEGAWKSPQEAGILGQAPNVGERGHPHQSSEAAISASNSTYSSPHNRLLYLLLGILLPLMTGLAGINNLVVGRTGPGLTQLLLSLFNYFMFFLGLLIGITLCIAIPLAIGILLWSVIEAATNTRDGQGLEMKFN